MFADVLSTPSFARFSWGLKTPQESSSIFPTNPKLALQAMASTLECLTMSLLRVFHGSLPKPVPAPTC